MDQEWICAFEWDQVTMSDGLWVWKLFLIKPNNEGKPELTKLVSGTAFNKLSVLWQVWRQCRKHNLKFRPWSNTWRSGTLPEENDG